MIRFLLTAAFLVLTTINPAYATEAIGKITHLDGEGFRTSYKVQEDLSLGTNVFLNDTIATIGQSTIKITFIDNTEIILGHESKMIIDEYVYDPKDNTNNKASFNMDESVFHYVSGLISKKENPDVKLNLAFGSIGIRGTEIWRDMVDDNGEKTCRIYIENGKIDVSNDNGKVTLGHGDGTKIKGLSNAPTAAKPWGEAAINDIKSKTKI